MLLAMATIGKGTSINPDDNVTDMLKNLNLTAEEEEVVEFSGDEEGDDSPMVEWALVGKVLSPTMVHAAAIQGAMKPAWGNPAGLKIRMIGKKGDNIFVAEFDLKQDMERALGGSPWLVGKHAVILRDYDESLKPSEISFKRIDIWARIMDLPLGWMNKNRGERAMGLIGNMKKMDVDSDGKASGPFLRARVAIEIAKPVRRGVLLKTRKDSAPKWFDIEYEKLPFYFSSCGIMGHSHLECDKPLIRNAEGKLPYDVKLRVSEPRKKKLQSFSEAAAETFGSASSSTSRQSRGSGNLSGDRRPVGGRSSPTKDGGEEVSSPLKTDGPSNKNGKGETLANPSASRQLFHTKKDEIKRVPRKRKSKTASPGASQTPDLNLPAKDTMVVVPTGFVSSRVSEIDGDGEELDTPSLVSSDELTKKQKRNTTQTKATSAVAARDSPRRAQ
jgi:hypothetical protein